MYQSKGEEPTQKTRHYGIDLLRVISMFMILVLHILGAGGVLGGVDQPGFHFGAAWFLEIFAYCAVNCYALISGYIGVSVKFRYTSLAMLWLQVILYMALGNILWYFLFPGSVDVKTILKSFFPVLQNHYWYFTAYFCMFLFMPLLERIVKNLDRKQSITTCVMIFVVFSILPTFLRTDVVFEVSSGYSVLWLSLLYIVGGCIRRHELLKNVPDHLLIVGYFVCVAIALASKLFISFTTIPVIKDNISSDILVSYTAPTIVLCSVFLLVLCGKHPRLTQGTEKVVSVLAPVSFGVYIIHAQPQVYHFFFLGGFRPFALLPTWGMVCAVILTAGIIYGICTIIDTMRIRLFKVLKVRQCLLAMETKLKINCWETESEDKEKPL